MLCMQHVYEVVEGFDYDMCWSDSWLHDIFVFEEDGVREASFGNNLEKMTCVQ